MSLLYISIQRLRIGLRHILGALFPKKVHGVRTMQRAQIAWKVKAMQKVRTMRTMQSSESSTKTLRTYTMWSRQLHSSHFNAVSQHIHESSSITYFLPYQHPVVKDLVWQMKYHKHADALLYSADLLYDRLMCTLYDDSISRGLGSRMGVSVGATDDTRVDASTINVVLIHIPSSSFARGEKEYDHMKEVFNILSLTIKDTTQISIHADAIQCSADTSHISQHHGKRKERLRWSKDRFYISEAFKERVQSYTKQKALHIICVDDVTTTGATFDAVYELLKEACVGVNIRIDFMAICH